ncbi:MAG: ABC transporter ATP-binding protein [Gemmatimonadota bacterium]
MLAFRNVTRRFRSPGGDVTAVHDVSLEGPSGGVWAVVGPNGAGKTTLFGLTLGFLHPTAGRITLEGDDPRRFVKRHGAAYLPERFTLPEGWRVRSALRALARLDGRDPATARREADTALERLGLEPHAGRPVGTLSRGLLQRLGLAQATLSDRPIVVLDEPMAGLDPVWRIRLRDLINELRSPERLVLIASHALAEVERVADHVVLLEDGQVRDVLVVRGPTAGPVRYRIRLAKPSPVMAEVFPDVAPLEGGTEYVVVVADTAELSQRLAALLARDVTLAEATPVVEPLEERVRRALDRSGDRNDANDVRPAGHDARRGNPADDRARGGNLDGDDPGERDPSPAGDA